MIRTSIRRISNKAIPYEPVPKNKYNQVRSQFNFKPDPTPGLVHNPPAAIVNPSMQIPKMFLPANDPRRNLETKRGFSKEIIDLMPIVDEAKFVPRAPYTQETAEQIRELRDSDPDNWTLHKLARRFKLNISSIGTIIGKQGTSVRNPVKEMSARSFEKARREKLWHTNQY